MNHLMKCVAILPGGLEAEGVKELIDLGAYSINSLKRSVSFEADLACFYRIHLLSRLPFRVLRQIAEFPCNGPDSLYFQIQEAFPWDVWISPSQTFRVDVSGSTFGLTHSHFSALQVKNAIIDLQRKVFGKRSSINVNNPDFCVHLHLNQGKGVVSLDSSRESLHRRGYRPAMGLAPLKENLAAGLIHKTQWDGSIPLVDPLCGSGIFLIEAVSIFLGIPSGLNKSFLFEKWLDFDLNLWNEQREIVKNMNLKNYNLPKIIGCEKDLDIANQAKENVSHAGLTSLIDVQNISFQDLELPSKKGILICNPPYGKRIGDEHNLINLYKDFGNFCKKNASGWDLWVLNGNPNLSKFLYMKSTQRIPINNGGIDCRFLKYSIN